MMVPRIPESSSRLSPPQRLWGWFTSLPRLVRFGVPALALLALGVGVAATAAPRSEPADKPAAASPASSPERGGGGGGRAVASPSAASINSTPTRQPFVVGEITPIPNRGISPTATPSAARPGDPLRLGEYSVTLLEVRDPVTSIFPLVKPTEGNRFVALQVQITNNASRTLPFSYLHFRLRDAGGTELRPSASTTLEPPLQTGNLAPNETVTAWVSFMPRQEVPVDTLYFQAPGMIGPRGQLAVR